MDVDVRLLVQLAALALLASVAAFGFRHSADTRRVYGMVACPLLLAMPAMLDFAAGVRLDWPVSEAPEWLHWLDQVLPVWVLAALALVSALLLGVRLTGIVAAERRARRQPLVDDERVRRVAAELLRRVPDAEPVKIRAAWGDEPCAATYSRTVLIPAAHHRWSDTTLRAVLAHELIHVCRRDGVLVTLLAATRALYWFFPYLAALELNVLKAIEESCDDRAADLIGDEHGYVSGIAQFAGSTRRPAGLLAMSRHPVAARVERFLAPRSLGLDTPALYWCLVTVLSFAFLISSTELSHLERVWPEQAVPLAIGPVHAGARSATPSSRYPEITVDTRAGAAGAHPTVAPRPVYPGDALRASIQGDVWVAFRVAADGTPVRARVVRSEPAGVFDGAALRAVERARFPSRDGATLGGERRVTSHFRFRLRELAP